MRGFNASRLCVVISRRSTPLCFVMLAVLAPWAMGDGPKPNPQRFVPARGLVAYVEYDGLRAHATAWEASAAYAMLAKTPAGAMMTDLATQVTDRLVKMIPGYKLTGADLIALQEHLVHEGFAIGYHHRGDEADSWTIVIHGAGRKGSRERFERFIGTDLSEKPATKFPPNPIKVRGRDIYQLKEKVAANGQQVPGAVPTAPELGVDLQEVPVAVAFAPRPEPPAAEVPWLSWWFEKDDLVLVAAALDTSSGVQDPATGKRLTDVHTRKLTAVLDVLEGKQPNVTSHPAYVSAISEGKDIKGFESDGLFFIDPGGKGGLFGALMESPAASQLGMLGLPSIPFAGEMPRRLASETNILPGAATPTPGSVYGLGGVVPPPASEAATMPVGAVPVPAGSGAPAAAPPSPNAPYGVPEAATAQVPSLYGTPVATPSPSSSPYGVPAELPPSTVVAARPASAAGVPANPPASPHPSAPVALAPASSIPPADDGPRPPPSYVVPLNGLSAPARPGQGPKADVKKEPDPIEMLGLDGVKRIVGRWGFQGKALLTDVRIEAPTPRKGLVAWLDQPAFDKDHLPPIPLATRAFVVDSFDPAIAYGRLIDLAKRVEPEMAGLIDQMERTTRDVTGLRLREDLLNHIGPTWCVLPVPSADGGGGKAELDPSEFVLVASLKDADGFAKVLDTLAERANRFLRDREKTNDGQAQGGRPADPPMLALERLPAPHRGYRLTSPSRLVFWLNQDVQPTILVGQSYLAVAVNAERAAEALAFERGAGARWRPTGALVDAFACLPQKLTLLSVGDHRDSVVPDTLAQLPSILQLLSTGLSDFDDPNAAMSMDFLTLLGVPGPGSFRVRIEPARIPRPEDLQVHLFPSVLAAAVDDRGIRFIAREAFPFACTGSRTYLKSSMKWSGSKGLKRDLKLGLGWFSSRAFE